ncbi:MAG: glycosyltransferase [Chitinophagaceae bacterium]|nr:glycosyltransferase [Chitinophagaceae bacterium]
MKKTILHIIDNLGRGGAETMLVTVVKQLPEYNNIIVTLSSENEFGKEVEGQDVFCLNMHSPLQVPFAAIRLRKIIKENNVSIVHSHLFWSTIVARLGVPKNTPLITTIHAFVASSIEYKPWHMKLIEKYTYKIRKSKIVAVAKGALEEYFSFINVTPHNACHLYTFVDTSVFKGASEKTSSETFRLVTVGNLKEQKDHRFLLEAFKELKDENIHLDIYGKGPLQGELQQTIDQHQLNVTLKGQVTDIQEQIGRYDLFVMSSLYEGFALSVLEAMALGMPTLLTDIASFKEQCDDTAAYYKLGSKNDFVIQLLALKNNRQQLAFLSRNCRKRALENYTLQKHLQGLKTIYSDTLTERQPALALSFAK